MTTTLQPEPQTARKDEKAAARQYVNFMFFKADRALRSESAEFKADSWCPECSFYKLRRTPKKRERNEYTY